jgi:hypothetical protein
MVQLNKNYSSYLDILSDNDYILATPSNDILKYCTMYPYLSKNNQFRDEKFINEHILESSDGKEFQSMNGKNYLIKEKKLVLANNQ